MFIERYTISQHICDDLINFYKSKNYLAKSGTSGNLKDLNTKESFDISIDSNCLDQPFYDYREELQKCLNLYVKKYNELNSFDKFNINYSYKIQYYPPGGGFKKWHCERMSKKNTNIVLVFMTYLNTVENAGTKFKYQNTKFNCVKGDTLIWPSDFTHTHKGEINNHKEKYIITGWFSFD